MSQSFERRLVSVCRSSGKIVEGYRAIVSVDSRDRPADVRRTSRFHGGRLTAVFDLSRGRQALLSIAQPGLAAVLAIGGCQRGATAVYRIACRRGRIPLCVLLNDVLDRKVDARSLRAGKDLIEGYDIDTAFERHPPGPWRTSVLVSRSPG